MILTKCLTPVDALLAVLGQHNGVVNITDTAQVNGKFYSIQVVTDTVFNTLTERNASGAIGTATIPAGTQLMGEFTSIKLTSGFVRAYKA